MAPGTPNDGNTIVYDSGTGNWIFTPGIDLTPGTPNDGDTIVYDSGTGKWVYTPGIDLAGGIPNDGDILVYDTATGKWVYTPGVVLAPGTPIDDDILVYDTTTSSWIYMQLPGSSRFNALNNVPQAITASVTTQLSANTVKFITKGTFASSRFTASIPGFYQINVNAVFENNNLANTLMLYANGSLYQYLGLAQGGNIMFGQSSSSLLIQLNAGDYLEVFAVSTGNTTVVLNEFSGIFIGS